MNRYLGSEERGKDIPASESNSRLGARPQRGHSVTRRPTLASGTPPSILFLSTPGTKSCQPISLESYPFG
jgi:hypothetical protein